MPAAEIEFDHRNKSLDGIVYIGYWEEHFRMAHEICNSFQHTPWFQDKGWENDSTKVCTGAELGDNVHEHIALVGLDNEGVIFNGLGLCAVNRRRPVALEVPRRRPETRPIIVRTTTNRSRRCLYSIGDLL